MTEFSQQVPLPALPDAQSSNPNNRRTNGYFESIREDVNMLDATAFREWRSICNESLLQLLQGMPKPPEAQQPQQPQLAQLAQQQLVLLPDGSLALQDGINVTKIDKTTLPQVTPTGTYLNTQINVPPPPATDLTGTKQEIVDYTVEKNVPDNTTPCHELWHAQFGSKS